MNDGDKYNLELTHKIGESNAQHLNPDDMKKWLTKSPEGIKKQLEEHGNVYYELSSMCSSTRNGLCSPESDMNPANYMGKALSNLLKDYQKPENRREMENAGIDRAFITNLKDCLEDLGYIPTNKSMYSTNNSSYSGRAPVTSHNIRSELTESMSNVMKKFEQEDQHKVNLDLAANSYERLQVLQSAYSIENDEGRKTGIEKKQSVELDRLKELGVTPLEAKEALRVKEIAKIAEEKDRQGLENRTAAVQRTNSDGQSVITTYDPKDISQGCYQNTRHYSVCKDGSLKPISLSEAKRELGMSPNSVQDMTKGDKFSTRKGTSIQDMINYGGR